MRKSLKTIGLALILAASAFAAQATPIVGCWNSAMGNKVMALYAPGTYVNNNGWNTLSPQSTVAVPIVNDGMGLKIFATWPANTGVVWVYCLNASTAGEVINGGSSAGGTPAPLPVTGQPAQAFLVEPNTAVPYFLIAP